MKTEPIKAPETAANSVIMDNDPSRLLIRADQRTGPEALNPMCKDCALRGHDCAGTACQTWTGCARKPRADGTTYTIKLSGKFYALSMDTSSRFIFGVGPDKGRVARIDETPGSTEGRNAAILLACTPCDTWRDAHSIAKAAGHYLGELYTD